MDEIPDNLIRVDPRVAAILDLTVDEVRALSLREIMNRAYDRGYEIGVSTKKARTGEGHLTIRMDKPGFITPA